MAPSSIPRPLLGVIILGSVVGTGFLVKAAVDNLTAGSGDKPGTPPGPAPSPRRSPGPRPALGGGFPLRLGQTGTLIKLLQQAIVMRGGVAAAEIINAGGVDGRFGNATMRALALLGESSTKTVTEAGFQRVTSLAAVPLRQLPAGPSSPGASSPGASSNAIIPAGLLNLPNFSDPTARNTQLPAVNALREQLKKAVARFDVSGTVACIRAMQNVAGYRAVNIGAYGWRWPEPGMAITARKSIVTRLSEVFGRNEAIRTALVGIGLTYGADGRWSAPF